MKIGIILTGDNTWAGGLYYSLNIIKLLSQISESKSLKIIAFVTNSADPKLLNEIKHKNVSIVNLDHKSFLYKAYCKLMGKLTSSNYRFVSDINAEKLDIIYPLIQYEKGHENLNCKAYYWLYDFQHKFLPELFSEVEIKSRDQNFKAITTHAKTLILSSVDSKNHLLQFYPDCRSKLIVYSFVSLIAENTSPKKLGLPENYLAVCNQFWPHKNHLVVLKAIQKLVKEDKNIHVVFTGKFDDLRNKSYVDSLRAYISENALEKHISFTGFIAREDQIEIIKNAKAVVQPSRFEGWSTVIEDAKALNKYIIASNLAIHREQLKDMVDFFDPMDHEGLAEYMHKVLQTRTSVVSRNYGAMIEHSKKDLVQMFNIQ